MTTVAPENQFVLRRFPLWAGGVGLLVYLLTLSHWITLLSVSTVANVEGWLWQPDWSRPLVMLVLAPFRLLPGPWIPVALNLFSAGCASGVLVLLARSVAILRQDMRPEGSLRHTRGSDLLSFSWAWLAPALAAVACGFQLTFWEHATSGTGDMLALLAFAYAFRCLFEYRLDPQQKWLSRCAVAYGAGMAGSWMLLFYLPLLVAAIIWVAGLGRFLTIRFLARMSLCGLAGWSLNLAPAVAQALSPTADPGFWLTVKGQLVTLKHAVLMLGAMPYRLFVVTAFLPFVVLAIRWKSHTIQVTDDNRLGIFITKAAGHLVHMLCLATGLWITLDPAFGPRAVHLGGAGLVYGYVWALGIGYCTGYVLLFAQHRSKGIGRQLPIALTGTLLAVWSVLLGWRNLPEIRFSNGKALNVFAAELWDGLPDGNSVVLSEDDERLLLLQGWALRAGDTKDPLPVDTTLLTRPEYHEYLGQHYPSRWPKIADPAPGHAVNRLALRDCVRQISSREPVLYLHPSSGHYVEPFVDEPTGSVCVLHPASTDSMDLPRPSESVMTANERLWQERWVDHLETLARRNARSPDPSALHLQTPLESLRLDREANATAWFLGAAYSKSLTDWGVRLQRAGLWSEAGVWFGRALELNPDNVPAQINLLYNQRHRAGDPSRLDPRMLRPMLGESEDDEGSWLGLLGRGGPVDEPTGLVQTGLIFLSSDNERQAARAFHRCLELVPDWILPKLLLAESLDYLNDFSAALGLLDEVEAREDDLAGPALAQLLRCRVGTLLGLGRTNDMVEWVETFVTRHGDCREVLSASARVHARRGELAESLSALTVLLESDPDNPELLRRKGRVQLQLGEYEAAATTFSRAVSMKPSDDQLLRMRAVALVGAGDLERAREDYLILLKRPGRRLGALQALGEIALQSRETNAAIHYFEVYLKEAPVESRGRKRVSQRLDEVRPD